MMHLSQTPRWRGCDLPRHEAAVDAGVGHAVAFAGGEPIERDCALRADLHLDPARRQAPVDGIDNAPNFFGALTDRFDRLC